MTEDNRPIVLAGFMGVGKTTIGRLLAESLRRPFYDSDGHVETLTGRSVDDFFLKQQETEFRRYEAKAVADLVAKGPVVIALGGGALMHEPTLALLRDRSLLVHLQLPWKDLRSRIPALISTRPLLRDRTLEEIHRLYRSRLAAYRSASISVTVETGSPAEAAQKVLAAVRGL